MFQNLPLYQFIPQKECLKREMSHADMVLLVPTFACTSVPHIPSV
jgi:hypothetical protein